MAMKQQLLRDSNTKPNDQIIADGLGTASGVYTKFIDELKKYNITLMEWRYYNDGKAWLSKGEYKWTTTRGTNKVKPIFWLSIWEGFFKISFFFSTGVQQELLALPISQEAKNIIQNVDTKGKTMKFLPVIFDVYDDTLLSDIYVLAQFRKEKI